VKIGPANNTTPLIGDKQDASQKTNRGREGEKTEKDQLDISSRARELQSKSKAMSEVPAEPGNDSRVKLNLIRLKLSNGYYDKPQTKTQIAEKLSADMMILREYYKSKY